MWLIFQVFSTDYVVSIAVEPFFVQVDSKYPVDNVVEPHFRYFTFFYIFLDSYSKSPTLKYGNRSTTPTVELSDWRGS